MRWPLLSCPPRSLWPTIAGMARRVGKFRLCRTLWPSCCPQVRSGSLLDLDDDFAAGGRVTVVARTESAGARLQPDDVRMLAPVDIFSDFQAKDARVASAKRHFIRVGGEARQVASYPVLVNRDAQPDPFLFADVYAHADTLD